jgi:hypothetical protein
MPDFDITVPHISRVYDYWLGGKDNFAADRELGEQTLLAYPNIVDSVRANRAFLVRSVRFLTTEMGIRQFLDIGAGLPTADNIHEVAQREAPDSRVVYADNDPVVLTHARALLRSTPEGALAYLDADLRDPGTIVAAAAETLDFSQPVALMMLGILGQIPDSDHPGEIIKRLMDPMVPGSYLAISDGVNTSETLNEASRQLNQSAHNAYHLRTPEQIAGFFDGLELLEPGVVTLTGWRADATPFPEQGDVPGRCGVGRKP